EVAIFGGEQMLGGGVLFVDLADGLLAGGGPVEEGVASGDIEGKSGSFGQGPDTRNPESGDQETETGDRHREGVQVNTEHRLQRPGRQRPLPNRGVTLLPPLEQTLQGAEKEM